MFVWSKLLSVVSVKPVEVNVRSLIDWIRVLFLDTIAKPEKSSPFFGAYEKLVAAKSFSIEAALLFCRFVKPTSSV